MKTIFRSLCLIAAAGTLSWGSVWVETGEAGGLPSTAQITSGIGSLTEIDGSLGDGTNGSDMYEITITNPTLFSAVAVDAGKNYTPNPSLFLFDSSGNALFADDNNGDTQADIPAGTLSALAPGFYFLLIAPQGNEPENSGSKALFDDTPSSGVVGPNSLANLVVAKYSKGGDGNTGKYEIDLTGAGFAETPEPGTIALMGAGLFAVVIRRKRT